MTSKKTKAERLKQSQLLKEKEYAGIDTTDPAITPPPGAVLADENELLHNNTYGRLPRFYVDKVIVCRQCGVEEVWPAERQKWWYEVAKRNIHSEAVLCKSCRVAKNRIKEEARRVQIEGLRKKQDETK